MANAGRSRAIVARCWVFLVLSAGFFAAASLLPRLLIHLSRIQPENYEYVASEAIRRGDFLQAEQVARRRSAQLYYDFTADFLLAEALAGQKRFDEAAAAIRAAIAKTAAAKGGRVQSSGYDESKAYARLTEYLWKAGNYFEAGEMARATIDTGVVAQARETTELLVRATSGEQAVLAAARLALKLQDAAELNRRVLSLDKATTGAKTQAAVLVASAMAHLEGSPRQAERLLLDTIRVLPNEVLPKLCLRDLLRRSGRTTETESLARQMEEIKGLRHLGPGFFNLPVGATATTTTIHLGRNGVATARVQTGVFPVRHLALVAQGTNAFGMYPLVIIRSGDKEIARLYIDAPQPRIYELTPWPDGAPKTFDLAIEFINDMYEPFTKADRNVTLSDILLY